MGPPIPIHPKMYCEGGQLKYHMSFLADVDDFRVIFGNEHDTIAFETDRETGNCLAACLLPLEDKEPGPFLGIY